MSEETLDEFAKRLVREENERMKDTEIKLSISIKSADDPKVEYGSNNPEHLKVYANKLVNMVTNEILGKCYELIDLGRVSRWDIRCILINLVSKFSKSKYYGSNREKEEEEGEDEGK